MTKEQKQLLKDFSQINSSYVLKNDIIAVLSADKSSSVFYTPSDLTEFDIPARIWDVNEFLNILDVMGVESELEINGKVINIKNGNKKIKYVLATETTVPNVPNTIEGNFDKIDVDMEIILNKADLEQIKRISSLLGLDEVKFTSDGSNISVELLKDGNDSSNNFKLDLEGKGTDLVFSLAVETIMKLRNDTYNIKATSVGIAKFESQTIDNLRYYMAYKA